MSSLAIKVVPLPFSTDWAFDEFIKLHCDYLAAGTSREVHAVRDARFVVKVAKDDGARICNWSEVAAFLSSKNDQLKLGEIVSWSVSGKYIVMERLDTSTDPPSDFLPPAWATDLGAKNGGLDDCGRYKLCDYAMVKSPDECYQSPFA